MLQTPEMLKAEHASLEARLLRATRAGGPIGDAAQHVARLLHPHLRREEAAALPLLGLLGPMAQGDPIPAEAARLAAEMAARLRADLPLMLEEHRAITRALDRLAAAAEAEGRMEFARFAEALKHHARTEEEILYPAALLVGARLGKDQPSRNGSSAASTASGASSGR